MYERHGLLRFGGVVLLLAAGLYLVTGGDREACSACGQQIAAQYSSPGAGLQDSDVCGSDGLTYMHSCLAECQGIVVAHKGACEGMPAMHGASSRQRQQAAAAAAGDEAMISGSAAAAAAAPLLDADTITKYADEGMKCVGYLTKRTFRPTMPSISMDRLAALQKQGQSLSSTVLLEVSNGVMYVGGPAARSGVAVPELTGDGSDEEDWDATGSSPGRRLQGGPSAAWQQHPSLRGAWWLLQHTAQQDSAAAAGKEDEDAAWPWASEAHTGADTSSSSSSSRSRSLSAVFGRDTRQEIKEPPTDLNYSPTGHLMFKSPSGIRYQCTGALVGPYAVLTAAHCLVARDGSVQVDIEFTPGQTYSNFSGLGTAKGMMIFFSKEYLGNNWEQHDYGVLLIDRPFGVYSTKHYTMEMMGIAQIKAQETSTSFDDIMKQFSLVAGWTPKRYGFAYGQVPMKDLRILSPGYPGDKKFNSYWWLACQVSDSQPISPVLMHRCPTVAGQSGAPLFEIRKLKVGNATKRFRVIRAITSHEMCDSVCTGACCNGVVRYNGATRITEVVKAFIDDLYKRSPYNKSNNKTTASPSPSPSP